MPYTRRLAVQDVSIEVLTNDIATALTSTSSEDNTFTPPTGYIYQLLGFYFSTALPAGGASGTHVIYLRMFSYAVATISAAFGADLQYDFSMPKAGLTPKPSDAGAFLEAVHGMWADAANGLVIRYTNSTNVSQTGTRYCTVIVKKIKVV